SSTLIGRCGTTSRLGGHMCARLLLLLIPALIAPFLLAGDKPDTPHPKIDQAALDKLDWKLGCQAWTFRKLSLFETLDTLNALGIHCIEFYPGQKMAPDQDVKFDHNATAAQIQAVLDKRKATGVAPMSYGVVDL